MRVSIFAPPGQADLTKVADLLWEHSAASVTLGRKLDDHTRRFDVALVLDLGPPFPVDILEYALANRLGLVVWGAGPLGMAPGWEDYVRVLPREASPWNIAAEIEDLYDALAPEEWVA